MIYEKLHSMDQVTRLKVRDIIPVLDEGDFIDGKGKAMLLERENNTMIFLVSNEIDESYYRILIEDIESGTIEPMTSRYHYDGFTKTIESAKINDKDVQEFRKVLRK